MNTMKRSTYKGSNFFHTMTYARTEAHLIVNFRRSLQSKENAQCKGHVIRLPVTWHQRLNCWINFSSILHAVL